jgi:hypothetical protein
MTSHLFFSIYQMGQLKRFIQAIECCDFKEVNAFFVSSVPGKLGWAGLGWAGLGGWSEIVLG